MSDPIQIGTVDFPPEYHSWLRWVKNDGSVWVKEPNRRKKNEDYELPELTP